MLVNKVYENNWHDKFRLNFTIPTYNRIDNLVEVLENFKLFSNYGFGVIILDNNSKDFDLDRLIKLLHDSKFGTKIYVNSRHLGPDANLLRSMELAVAPWIFLLGDSKILRRDIVDIVLRDVEKYPFLKSIVYSFDKVIYEPVVISSLDEFFKSGIKFGDLFLGGNSIIEKSVLDNFLHTASMLTLSRSMLTIFHILNLRDSKSILFSNIEIVEIFLNKPANKYDPRFSLLECWAQFSLLTTLDIGDLNQVKLNKIIIENETFENYWIFIKFCLIQIFREKKVISPYLRKIIKFRYVHYSSIGEKLFVYPLYYLARIYERLNQ